MTQMVFDWISPSVTQHVAMVLQAHGWSEKR